MFGLQIIINTVLLCGGDSPVISWPWWLNIGGSRLEQYFTVLEVAAPPELHAIATESSESVREGCFPKPSCYLSDFLIRLDSWLHCTAFGWNSAGLKSCTFELFMCTVQGGIAGNFCLCMAFVYLAAQTAIQQMFEPWNAFLFFLDLKRFGLFLTYFAACRAARRVAIQFWSVLNCRGSNSHREDSYLCSITQSADSTDFKEHLKRCEERDSGEIVFKVVTFSKTSVM